MNISDFFDFGTKLLSSTAQVESSELKVVNEINQYHNLIEGNYEGINFPVIFKQEYGKNFTDILGTGYTGLYIISTNLKVILEEAKFTGWKTYPVKIYDKKGKEVNGYHGFSVTGKCGPVQNQKSEIIEKRFAPTGPISQYYKGLYIGLDQWDGTDFFIPAKTLCIVVTKCVADRLKKHKFSNLHMKNLADKERVIPPWLEK